MTTPPRLARWAAALSIAALTAACSSVTSGTPAPQHTSAAPSATAAAPTPTTPSAEDEIRQTLLAFQDAYNTQNWDASTQLMCSAMRAQFTGPVLDYVKKGRADTGLTHLTITKVNITGDTAIATMDS